MAALLRFVRTTFLGGLIVLLPAAVVAAVFLWIWSKLTAMVQPLTALLLNAAGGQQPTGPAVVAAQLLALAILAALCFAAGLGVRCAAGRYLHSSIENRVLRFAPGYNLIKETVLQLLGGRKSPFSQVALVRPYDGEALMTGFVTDEHASGWRTVFIPTGPNPTSGNIFHLPADRVHLVDAGVENAMRTIISCGAGSEALIEMHLRTADRPGPADRASEAP